jgi:hypothetical protein
MHDSAVVFDLAPPNKVDDVPKLRQSVLPGIPRIFIAYGL